jgi:alkylation response protein AidB-like acyl-CoA dehydrogenase
VTISVAERADLRSAVRDLLHDECTEHDVRRVMSSEDGFDRTLWQKLAAHGVTGLLVDADYGGVGLGALELEVAGQFADRYLTGAAPAGWSNQPHERSFILRSGL